MSNRKNIKTVATRALMRVANSANPYSRSRKTHSGSLSFASSADSSNRPCCRTRNSEEHMTRRSTSVRKATFKILRFPTISQLRKELAMQFSLWWSHLRSPSSANWSPNAKIKCATCFQTYSPSSLTFSTRIAKRRGLPSLMTPWSNISGHASGHSARKTFPHTSRMCTQRTWENSKSRGSSRIWAICNYRLDSKSCPEINQIRPLQMWLRSKPDNIIKFPSSSN